MLSDSLNYHIVSAMGGISLFPMLMLFQVSWAEHNE